MLVVRVAGKLFSIRSVGFCFAVQGVDQSLSILDTNSLAAAYGFA